MKDANVKSKRELVNRIMSGEKIYYLGRLIEFDETRAEPFRFGDEALRGVWGLYRDYTTKGKWYKNIPNGGVLCWVSDRDESEKTTAILIARFSRLARYRFLDGDGTGWCYATPVKPSDIKGEDE